MDLADPASHRGTPPPAPQDAPLMTPLLAQSCPAESPGCDWLLDQGVPEWLAIILGGVAAPMGSALLILLGTAIVAAIARRLVVRAAVRFRDPKPAKHVGGMKVGSITRPDPRRHQRITAIAQVSRSIVTVVVWTIGLMMALGAFGVNLGPLIASAGILGVALGFGAQSLVEDFLSGMFMLAEDQFGVGDIIDLGEATGVVESISLRTTSLRGTDGTLWFVPNGQVQRVGNMSQDWARALLDVSIAYDADVDQAMDVIGQTCADFAAREGNADQVLEDPEILGVEDLGADAVVIRLWIKTVPGQQYALARALRRDIKLALDDAGIGIPFPQRTVWLRHEGDADNLPEELRPEPDEVVPDQASATHDQGQA